MKRWEWAMAIGVVLSVLLSGMTAFAGECQEIRQETLRLHILANSDSAEDQQLKLAVRYAVLTQWGEEFSRPMTQAEARALAEELLPQMEETAREEIAARGYSYPAGNRRREGKELVVRHVPAPVRPRGAAAAGDLVGGGDLQPWNPHL